MSGLPSWRCQASPQALVRLVGPDGSYVQPAARIGSCRQPANSMCELSTGLHTTCYRKATALATMQKGIRSKPRVGGCLAAPLACGSLIATIELMHESPTRNLDLDVCQSASHSDVSLLGAPSSQSGLVFNCMKTGLGGLMNGNRERVT